MKPLRIARLAVLALALAVIASQANAVPARVAPPSVEANRVEVQRICHHYRWSSRSHCTNAQAFRFIDRPPLYYPHKYYGGSPHYAQRAFTYPYHPYSRLYFSPYGFYHPHHWYRRHFWSPWY